MKDQLVSVDRAGRIELPTKAREELGINPGDTLKLSILGRVITLTPIRETAGFVRKGKALVFSTRGGETLTQKMVDLTLEKVRREGFARATGRKR